MADKNTPATTTVEAPAETTKALTEAQQDAIDTFLARFAIASNRKKMSAMLNEGKSPEDFAHAYGKSPQHKKYLAAEYAKVLKTLS